MPSPISKGTRDRADQEVDEPVDYQEQVFWEPNDSDAESDDKHQISVTTERIVKNTCSRWLKPEKERDQEEATNPRHPVHQGP